MKLLTSFRLFHSLKGGAGFLNLNVLQHVAHEAESMLDIFRKEDVRLESHHIDLFTKTCDFLRDGCHLSRKLLPILNFSLNH
ncbi:Hpt domain-containing protein [bacterium]|nr:Hpt domain-containing protein [bacterium]